MFSETIAAMVSSEIPTADTASGMPLVDFFGCNGDVLIVVDESQDIQVLLLAVFRDHFVGRLLHFRIVFVAVYKSFCTILILLSF